MTKRKKQVDVSERTKINVAIYSDEFEQVAEKIDLSSEDITSRTIRNFFGLKPVAKRIGLNRQLKDALNDVSDEKKAEILAQLKEE